MARALYLEAGKYCDSINGRVPRDPLRGPRGGREGHIDFLKTQLNLVEQLGLALDSQKHVGAIDEGEHSGSPGVG